MPDDQGPSMEMRAFIAVVLSLGVMVGYQYLFAPEPLQPRSGEVTEAEFPEPLNLPEIEVPEAVLGDEETKETTTSTSTISCFFSIMFKLYFFIVIRNSNTTFF